ncbi:IclR family transcriptional regulator [Microvirga brassicacearum]|nr:IclR family transcriptional regulator [Microvirga brassicacearum]
MSLVLDKALNLIGLVAAGNQTLVDLIRESELSRSTTHRLLSTLVAHGYLSYSSKRYDLGFKLLELGEKKKRSLDFVETLRPTLQEYAERVGDTLHLAILDGPDIILVERIAGRRELQIRSHVGQRAPAYRTAVGKALIGRRPSHTWNAYLQNIPKHYARNMTEIRSEFENAKRRRFATDFEEVSLGTCGVAAAFRVNQFVDAAVSINGATVYFQNDRLTQLSSTVIEMADRFQSILGNSGK